MQARARLDGPVSVASLAAAAAATMAALPGVWPIAGAFATLILAGIGLVLAARRMYQHENSSSRRYPQAGP